MVSGNGRAPLSKAALADKSKFQFRRDEVPLPELGDPDGFIVVKALSVAERDALPDLTDKDGNPAMGIENLAAVFAAAVEEPSLTVAEAQELLKGWPASALDKVIEKFGDLTGSKEEAKAAAGTFPADE